MSHLAFSPVSPYELAATASMRIQVYLPRQRKVVKTISRFKETAFSGEFRADGQVLAAGDSSGTIQLFDLSSRAILRTLSLHVHPVHVVKFSPVSNTTLLSASDDKTVRIWDIPSGSVTTAFTEGHTDYIRSAQFFPGSNSLVITGGYDRLLCLWDARASSKTPMAVFTHDDPINDLKVLEHGNQLWSAGGTNVKVWDMAASRGSLTNPTHQALRTLGHHIKGVTCLATNSTNDRMLAGGLNGQIKIYSIPDCKVVHRVKYAQPILSIALSPDDKHLAVGMTNSTFNLRTRTTPSTTTKPKKRPSYYARMMRGINYRGDNEQIYLQMERHKSLQIYDKLLRSFRYSNVLDSVMDGSVDRTTTYTVLLELSRRNGLTQALQDRNEAQLFPIVQWCTKYISEPRYVALILQIIGTILDLYGQALWQNENLALILTKLEQKIGREVQVVENAAAIKGMLDMLFACQSQG